MWTVVRGTKEARGRSTDPSIGSARLSSDKLICIRLRGLFVNLAVRESNQSPKITKLYMLKPREQEKYTKARCLVGGDIVAKDEEVGRETW